MIPSKQERREDERVDRALALLNGPLFWRFVHALDVIGWKIVHQNPARAGERLAVPIGSKRKRWPNWIDDDRTPPPRPTLRLVPPDDERPSPP